MVGLFTNLVGCGLEISCRESQFPCPRRGAKAGPGRGQGAPGANVYKAAPNIYHLWQYIHLLLPPLAFLPALFALYAHIDLLSIMDSVAALEPLDRNPP